jgi:enamine deaminase RidA (YjgF/YER057c/UK114 family)
MMRFNNPPTLPKPVGYSHVVEVPRGRTLFISGQVALDSAGNLIGRGDFVAQTEQVFKNIQAALESVGAGCKDLAKLTIFVVDISQVPALREIRNRYVNSANPPASSLVQVKGLVREEFLVEIEAVAVVPE